MNNTEKTLNEERAKELMRFISSHNDCGKCPLHLLGGCKDNGRNCEQQLFDFITENDDEDETLLYITNKNIRRQIARLSDEEKQAIKKKFSGSWEMVNEMIVYTDPVDYITSVCSDDDWAVLEYMSFETVKSLVYDIYGIDADNYYVCIYETENEIKIFKFI